MGVPAFFRWLSEKYPKVLQDVLEERLKIDETTGRPLPFDSTRPNPSGLECDNLYLDMNGLIHPCCHPESGQAPKTEPDMYVAICKEVDRLVRAIRPRALLYLAIDGVAPRAKMNQQRARRFRSAQEARELLELEQATLIQMTTTEDKNNSNNPSDTKEEEQVDPTDPAAARLFLQEKQQQKINNAWDSNVITPGTPFMVHLAEYLRFYIRYRLTHDKAWQGIRILFSDASIPGEGEHKIMAHVRLQRAQPQYNPNLVHVLHGLDADLIMLGLATHEAHFYVSRELVTFGRKSQEQLERRQEESGFRFKQEELDQAAGSFALEHLEENIKAVNHPLQRVSIPILRQYLQAEFADTCLNPKTLPFRPSLERLIDDVVFLCFFVGNDFLPHLPSLDIRDGALDFLFNVYKRVLPSLGQYITSSGGNIDLVKVNVILQHVGAIEDYVFAMKHDKEEQSKRFRQQQREQKKRGGGPPPPGAHTQFNHKVRGRSAKILSSGSEMVKLDRGHQAKERQRQQNKQQLAPPSAPVAAATDDANAQAALAFKQNILPSSCLPSKEEHAGDKRKSTDQENQDGDEEGKDEATSDKSNKKRAKTNNGSTVDADGAGLVGEIEEEFGKEDVDEEKSNDGNDDDDDDDDLEDEEENAVEKALEADMAALAAKNAAAAEKFKESVKAAQQKKLDDYAANVEDNVRLHEAGWKDRYYSDKCKADDVQAHGGREHLFRSYVVGLCWVMKYYYDGCPSWKWYFPFHYAPFASDLQNVERFQKDVKSMELAKPFNPVEQLMAVLPSDSSHAIPKAARWLMCDNESPIIDFYPKDVPVDPNGKAMPWLWVVLLPFIEETRLLDALMPTMSKWSKGELLCNARGLDDGYLYVHKSHPLCGKLTPVVTKGKTAQSPKTRLTNAVGQGTTGFSGLVRPPLSNELYAVEEETKIPLPASASKIEDPSSDGLFRDDIDINVAVCVAFSEPTKFPHKSILLPGARSLPPCLTDEDKRIRRPRLGRGGTIAHMGGGGGGGGQGQSHQSGYGSMNISSYERDLAHRQGRGHEMYKPGTRSWGAMEPVPKRMLHRPQQHSQHRQQQPPPLVQPPPNPFMQQQQQHRHANNINRHSNTHNQSYGGRGGGRGPSNNYQGGPPRGGYHSNNRGSHPPHARGPPGQQQQPQQQQGFSFRNHNYGGPPPPPHQRNQPPPSQGQQQRSRASADAMQNLRAQLSNTLRQNRKPGSGGPS